MDELITKIEGDSMFMLMALISVVVLLIIVLIIIVSAMIVKNYKNRCWNLTVDNKDKLKEILILDSELQRYKIEDIENKKKLLDFVEIKTKLHNIQNDFSNLKKNFSSLEDELTRVKDKLKISENIYANLLEEYEILKEEYFTKIEENKKYRTDNSRLLMKLKNII